MDSFDKFLVVVGIVWFFLLGLAFGHMLGQDAHKKIAYQACETRQPLVIEMGGVKHVYACMRVAR